MAQTIEQIYQSLLASLPARFTEAEPLLAGVAAALQAADASVDTMAQQASIGAGEGIWLTLQGEGLGVYRGEDETDAQLRDRLRFVEDRVTPAAITGVVDLIIAPDSSQIVEWFEGPWLDNDNDSGLWLDNATSSGGPNSFTIAVPQVHVDDPATCRRIIAAVQQFKAAGTFWRLLTEQAVPTAFRRFSTSALQASSAVPSAHPELSMVLPEGWHKLEAYLRFASDSATAGLRAAFNLTPNPGAGELAVWQLDADPVDLSPRGDFEPFELDTTGGGTLDTARFTGAVKVPAGGATLSLWWGQRSTEPASPTTLHAGSMLEASPEA